MLGRVTLAAGPVMKGAFARERLGLSRVLSASTSESLTRPFHPPGHARCIMLRCRWCIFYNLEARPSARKKDDDSLPWAGQNEPAAPPRSACGASTGGLASQTSRRPVCPARLKRRDTAYGESRHFHECAFLRALKMIRETGFRELKLVL